jgi:hypothetical protein
LSHFPFGYRQSIDEAITECVTDTEQEGTMTSGVRTIVIPVKDAARSKETYAALLGVAPHTDQPYYVGFNVAGQEIGLDPNGGDDNLIGLAQDV